MISAAGMWREASAAKRIMSTAPTAKLGAITALAGPCLGARSDVLELGVGESGGPDHRVYPGREVGAGVVEHERRLGEIDGHVDPAGRQRRADVGERARTGRERRIDACGDPHALGRRDRLDDRTAHASGGTGHHHPDHRARASSARSSGATSARCGVTLAMPARIRSGLGPTAATLMASGCQNSAASAWMSGASTASTSSMISSIVSSSRVGHHRPPEPVHARAGRLGAQDQASLEVVLGAAQLRVAGCGSSRSRRSSVWMIAQQVPRLSSRVPRWTTTCPASA